MTEEEKEHTLLMELQELNQEYFGTFSLLEDVNNPGQLACYQAAEKAFWQEQKGVLQDYFREDGWDWSDGCDSSGYGAVKGRKGAARVIFTRGYQNGFGTVYFLTVEKEKGRKTYLLELQSDFTKNPHYEPKPEDGRYPYKEAGLRPENLERLEAWVNDVRQAVERIWGLGKEYYFCLSPCLYDSDSADYVDQGGRFPALVDFIEAEITESSCTYGDNKGEPVLK